jgi:predicted permease
VTDLPPDWRSAVRARLEPLGLAATREADIAFEIVQHLDDRYREHRSAGEPPDAAARLALADLDDPAVLTERLRTIERTPPANPPVFGGRGSAAPALKGLQMLTTIRQDLAYALRSVRRQPAFTSAAVGMLAIGIAATTTIFALVNGLLLKPLPVARPNELVGIYTSDYSGPRFSTTSYADFLDWRARNTTLSGMTAFRMQSFNLSTDSSAVRVFAELVTGNYLDTTGVRLEAGPGFSSEADAPAGAGVAIVSYNLWRRQLQSDGAIIGRTIMLNNKPFVVRGVAKPGYTGLTRGLAADLWIPIAAQALLSPNGNNELAGRGSRSLLVVGRLKPGVGIDQVQTQFNTIAAALHVEYPQSWTDRTHQSRVITVLPEAQSRFFPSLRGQVLGFFAVLMVVAGLVIVIACANIANLLLARAVSRSREIATRVALGASRGRIVQQLLTEGLLLSVAAGVAGIMLALWATRLVGGFQPPVPMPVSLDLSLDGRVIALDLVMMVATTLLFGLAPAMNASRPQVMTSLKDSAAAVTGGRSSRLRQLFVVTQVTVSLVLLVGAGLFLRSLENAASIDPGFQPRGLVIASVDLTPAGYNEARGREFYDNVLARLRAMPSVKSASAADVLPLGLGLNRRSITIDGYRPQDGEDMEVASATASPGHFSTMQTPLIAGRDFQDTDTAASEPVVIVNQAFVNRYWPGQNAIGKRVTYGSRVTDTTRWLMVVGVTATGKYGTLGEDPTPYFYAPLTQQYEPGVTFVVRSTADASSALGDLRRLIAEVDRSLPVLDAQTMDEYLGVSLLPARLAGAVLGAMGAVGLLLAAAGLYGVIAYAVSLRTREIGVRLSLGATPRSVFVMVVRQGLFLTGVGCVVGLVLAAVASQAIGSQLYGIRPLDPVTFIGVIALLLIVAGGACAVPAWRSMRMDPLKALRQD